MLTVLAFVVALGILIAVHEYGHYRVAVACGVKVLRFSVGFGKPVLQWKSSRSETEFVLGAIPLGGYVKMLDEREGPVAPELLPRAFNRQPLTSRALVVAAGPAANLLLAVVLYAAVNWMGMEEPRAILSMPAQSSIAYQAGIRGQEKVTAVQVQGQEVESIQSFEQLRWMTVQAALEKKDISLFFGGEHGNGLEQKTVLALSSLTNAHLDADVGKHIGIQAPWTAPVIEKLVDNGAALRQGLHAGDIVQNAFGVRVVDGFQLRQLIRENPSQNSEWTVLRNGSSLQIPVIPDAELEANVSVGRVGAYIGAPAEMVLVRHGWIEGLIAGIQKTWDVSWLSLKMMGRMLIGEASLKNLSGPLTIADYAGKSASMGFVQYVAFLALISVSLGVLNLLPLPVLDGGHLMYYLWEGITKRPISSHWMERLQKAGVGVLLVMMCIAFFNDISRLLG